MYPLYEVLGAIVINTHFCTLWQTCWTSNAGGGWSQGIWFNRQLRWFLWWGTAGKCWVNSMAINQGHIASWMCWEAFHTRQAHFHLHPLRESDPWNLGYVFEKTWDDSCISFPPPSSVKNLFLVTSCTCTVVTTLASSTEGAKTLMTSIMACGFESNTIQGNNGVQ